MGKVPLPKPLGVPCNPVRAQELQKALQEECGKQAWRDAMEDAKRRWSGQVEKIAPQAGPRRKGKRDLPLV